MLGIGRARARSSGLEGVPFFKVAAVALLIAAGASAAPLAARAESGFDPVSAPFSGVYIGIHGGYAWGDTSVVDGGTPLGAPPNPPYGAFACGPAATGNYCNVPFELSPDGGFGGLQMGFNVQSGMFVIGAEGDLGWIAIEGDKLLNRPFADQDFASADYGFYATLTGRVGLAVDRGLIYFKGGAAFADIENTAADFDGGAPYAGSVTSRSGIETGWTLGGGIEYLVSDGVSLKAEYLHMDFGSSTSRSSDGDIYRYEHELDTVKLGLNLQVPTL